MYQLLLLHYTRCYYFTDIRVCDKKNCVKKNLSNLSIAQGHRVFSIVMNTRHGAGGRTRTDTPGLDRILSFMLQTIRYKQLLIIKR